MSVHRRHREPGLLFPGALATIPPMGGIGTMVAADWTGPGPTIAAVFEVLVFGMIGFAVMVQRDARWRRHCGEVPGSSAPRCPACAARWDAPEAFERVSRRARR